MGPASTSIVGVGSRIVIFSGDLEHDNSRPDLGRTQSLPIQRAANHDPIQYHNTRPDPNLVLTTLLCALPSPLLGECDSACITLCGQGDEASCENLGSLLSDRQGHPERGVHLFDVDSTSAPTEGAELRGILVKACKAKVGYACDLLGVAEEHASPDRLRIDATR